MPSMLLKLLAMNQRFPSIYTALQTTNGVISSTLKNKPLKGFNEFKSNIIEISRRVSTGRSIKVV